MRRAHVYKKCLSIRDRLYPRETWATERYTGAVLTETSPGQVLLDLGCGRTATWLRAVTRRFTASLGVDPEVSDSSEGNMRLIRGSAYCIPCASHSVDIISMRNLLEHLDAPGEAMAECLRVLKPGGTAFVLTPNKWFPPVALGRLLPHSARWRINRLLTGAGEADTFRAFYRANTSAALKQLARDAGFRSCMTEYISEQPVYFMFSVALYRCWAAFERLCLRRKTFAGFRHYILCKLGAPES